ncbi:MAG: DUF499 domain-containing protein [Chloroflexota bacterium]
MTPIPFHTIAIPHDDILKGRLTLDVFAADLWEVYHQRGPEEYRDSGLFFQKTYLTTGLKNLIGVIQQRLQGKGGDPVIQMQTPFGGGKTHSLIALYHKAREWGVKTVVISGTPLSARETLWGIMAEQLNGSKAGFEDAIAPGREAIQELLSPHQPVLILMDEVLEYMVKAAAVKVGDSNLASQTLAFMQELTEAVTTLEKAALVITLPSSTLEHYDEQATRLFEQLKKISGRVEKIFTPVQDEEIGAIIRRRLFSHVDENAADQVILTFIEQAEKESLIANSEESAQYRNRFKATYPFLPEVVDALYHRWGSYPSFQRTRGTLRLLALVIHALKNAACSYITLADFDLHEGEIRRELLKYIGTTYDSVIAADILSENAGARKVNQEIGKTYQGLKLGERVATTIFMYSFLGGGVESGAFLNEIKRQNLLPGVPSSIVSDVLEKLEKRFLFYLHERNGRYFFSAVANLNQALLNSMENIKPEELYTKEREILGNRAGGKMMKVYLWPESPADIPDTPEMKLVILPESDQQKMQVFLSEKGQTPRVHRNTLFFLVPSQNERPQFKERLRRYLAVSSLLTNRVISLTPEQRQDLQAQEKQLAKEVQEQIASLYRLLYASDPDGLISWDLGMPTFGENQSLDQRAYERLRTESRLVEKLVPVVIQKKYLSNNNFIKTRQLIESGSRTPGEMIAIDQSVWVNAISQGVQQGLFGLGELDDEEQPRCLHYKENAIPVFGEQEILIRSDLCEKQKVSSESESVSSMSTPDKNRIGEPQPVTTKDFSNSVSIGGSILTGQEKNDLGHREHLNIRLELPFGKASNLLGLLNLLQYRFRSITITIQAKDGQISESEIEDKLRETFRQMGVEDVEIE